MIDTATELTVPERNLLEWLGEEDFSRYGECRGRALNLLVEHGLAKVHKDDERFWVHTLSEDREDYQAVSLTDAGRDVLRTLK
jgi:hypothetical protein